MNCRDIEPLLLAERDGGLASDQSAALERHVAACAPCRQLRARLAETLDAMQADAAAVALPDVDAEWHILRARLCDESPKPARKRPLAPVIWFGASAAVAAALALTYLGVQSKPSETDPVRMAQTETPGGTTMAYVDKDSGWLVVWAADSGTDTGG